MPNENDVHGMDDAPHAAPVRAPQRSKDQSFTVRDLVKALADVEDMDQSVSLSVLNMDPVPVTGLDYGDGEVILQGSV